MSETQVPSLMVVAQQHALHQVHFSRNVVPIADVPGHLLGNVFELSPGSLPFAVHPPSQIGVWPRGLRLVLGRGSRRARGVVLVNVLHLHGKRFARKNALAIGTAIGRYTVQSQRKNRINLFTCSRFCPTDHVPPDSLWLAGFFQMVSGGRFSIRRYRDSRWP